MINNIFRTIGNYTILHKKRIALVYIGTSITFGVYSTYKDAQYYITKK
jgi:hypothetical protein